MFYETFYILICDITFVSGQPDKDLFSPKMDQNDAQLLSDLMSDAPMQGDDNQSGFSAQWNALFGQPNKSNANTMTGEGITEGHKLAQKESNLMSPSSEFGDFMSAAKTSDALTAGDTDLFGILQNKESSKSSNKTKNKSFLPSQLFDLDQSLYSQQSPRSGRFTVIKNLIDSKYFNYL